MVSLAFIFDKTVTGHSVWAQNMFCHIREEWRLRAFENRMLRKIFGSKREEAAGDSRKIHTEEPHNLHSSTDSFRVMKSWRMR
jgi:hypothetical protein